MITLPRALALLVAVTASCAPLDEVLPVAEVAAPTRTGASTPAAPIETPSADAQRCAAGHVWIDVVEGRLIDDEGVALANEAVGLCGSTCFGASTRSDGRFTVRAGYCFPVTARYPAGAVFDVYGRGYHADVSIGLDPERSIGLDRVELGDVSVPALFAAPSVPVPEKGDAAGRLALSDGFSLGIAPGSLDLALRSIDHVSAVRVEHASLPPFLGLAAARVGALYAVTPSGARCAARASITLPNDDGLAPGATVEIVMVGEPLADDVLPPGSIGAVDTGHVSDDGRTVVADHGVPFLGWVGYRTR